MIICELPNLIKFEVPRLIGADQLNLVELNTERAKVTGAKKLIIFISEKIFLETKWTTPNGDINLSYIQLKRQYAE